MTFCWESRCSDRVRAEFFRGRGRGEGVGDCGGDAGGWSAPAGLVDGCGAQPKRGDDCGASGGGDGVGWCAGWAKAAQLIDLTRQSGVHPRIGAADVVPFVPVSGFSLAQCAMLARQAGLEIWRRCGVPVYFYEAAATRPDRIKLEDVRRGQFEGLRDSVATGCDAAAGCGRAGDSCDGGRDGGGCAAVPDRVQHLSGSAEGR